MLLKTIPANDILTVCGKWKVGDSLQELIGGQLFSVIESIDPDDSDEIHLATSSDLVLEDCALMLWIAKQLSNTSTVGCFWASDYQCGAIALHKGQFTEFSVSVEVLLELQKRLLLDQIDEAVIDGLREQGLTEDEISSTLEEWSDDYGIEARDRLQLDFLRSIHDENPDLTSYPYFKILSELECEWNINDLPSMAADASDLLTSVDYSDPTSVDSIFRVKDGEFWKQHRKRIREVLEHLPVELKDNKDLFKRIIPHVAAWPLEYAGPAVRSDKEIIRLAVKADKTHNYGASAFEYASTEILQDEAFVKEILAEQPSEFYNLPDHLKEQRDLLKIVLKAGLFFPENKSSDRELLEVYVSSGNTWVYNRIPEELKDDPELAKIYLKNGGEWDVIPEQLRGNQSIFECYLAANDFDSDSILPTYRLKCALQDHLGVNDWHSTPVTVSFLEACLQLKPQFLSLLRYGQLKPDEWLTIAKKYNVVEYASRPLKLRLALELEKQFSYTELFDQLNELPLDGSGTAEVDSKLRDIAVKMMELELHIAETSGEY